MVSGVNKSMVVGALLGLYLSLGVFPLYEY